MALHSTASIVEYSGNGATRAFALPFAYDRAASIQAVLIEPGGAEHKQTQGAHFTVEPDGSPSGGTVTFATAPAAGWTVRLMRILPLTQVLQLPTQGAFTPAALEQTLDRIVMMLQQLNDGLAVNSMHGDQPGGSLHPIATREVAGFAGPEQVARWDDHVDTSGNPHGTTWEDVGGAPADHRHDDDYAPTGHNHDDDYAPKDHDHDDRYGSRGEADDAKDRLDDLEGQVPPLVEWKDETAPKILGYDVLLPTLAPKKDPVFEGVPRVGLRALLDESSSIDWSKLTGRPTTVGGMGLTDAATKAELAGKADKATTLAGYGILDGVTAGQLAAAEANAATALAQANSATLLIHSKSETIANHEARLVVLEQGGGGGGGPSGGGNFFDARCDEGLQVGDVVVPGGIGVKLADPSDLASMPAVGIVVVKTTPTQARVQTAGVLWDALTGLTMGATYYVGLDGRPTNDPPKGPPDTAQQRIGVALSSTALLVFPSTEMFIHQG
ncbi:MAG TPA: hypothetical protein VN033_10335 [Vulgatibacter sp.]|nr:hypothetical protein [Vulgatibacter sp.]